MKKVHQWLPSDSLVKESIWSITPLENLESVRVSVVCRKKITSENEEWHCSIEGVSVTANNEGSIQSAVEALNEGLEERINDDGPFSL